MEAPHHGPAYRIPAYYAEAESKGLNLTKKGKYALAGGAAILAAAAIAEGVHTWKEREARKEALPPGPNLLT